jgi:hypothetical protein
MTTRTERIDDYTERLITCTEHVRSTKFCDQCGMACSITPHPRPNRAIASGADRCYGCQWANVALSGRKHEGMTFSEFAERKMYLAQLQGV